MEVDQLLLTVDVLYAFQVAEDPPTLSFLEENIIPSHKPIYLQLLDITPRNSPCYKRAFLVYYNSATSVTPPNDVENSASNAITITFLNLNNTAESQHVTITFPVCGNIEPFHPLRNWNSSCNACIINTGLYLLVFYINYQSSTTPMSDIDGVRRTNSNLSGEIVGRLEPAVVTTASAPTADADLSMLWAGTARERNNGGQTVQVCFYRRNQIVSGLLIHSNQADQHIQVGFGISTCLHACP